MAQTYAQATSNVATREAELNRLLASTTTTSSDLIHARGRYIASLQAQLRAANRSGMPTAGITSELNRQLQEQKRIIKVAIGENKAGRNYSIIKEMSLGVKDLVTSIKQVKNTTGSAKKTATKNMINSIGLNLKNTVKAPITITTRILKSTIVATVLFAPISLGMGILHAAWTCLDSSPSPYDNSGVEKMSRGFQSAMNKLNSKIERI